MIYIVYDAITKKYVLEIDDNIYDTLEDARHGLVTVEKSLLEFLAKKAQFRIIK